MGFIRNMAAKATALENKRRMVAMVYAEKRARSMERQAHYANEMKKRLVRQQKARAQIEGLNKYRNRGRSTQAPMFGASDFGFGQSRTGKRRSKREDYGLSLRF